MEDLLLEHLRLQQEAFVVPTDAAIYKPECHGSSIVVVGFVAKQQGLGRKDGKNSAGRNPAAASSEV